AVLPVAFWFLLILRLDLYNKSRMTGDCQVRFCEKLGVKLPLLTRLATVKTSTFNNSAKFVVIE
ncbi:MAG: hypothetical protein K9J13_08415, partial [Saprospiraceae bacterium]|nr:hypothetical protein [Saprospiraceae bacterium]